MAFKLPEKNRVLFVLNFVVYYQGIFVVGTFTSIFKTVFRIRIHRIHMFLGLPDSDPDLLYSGKNFKKNLKFYCFVTFLDFLSLKNDVNVPSKSNKQKNFFTFLRKLQ